MSKPFSLILCLHSYEHSLGSDCKIALHLTFELLRYYKVHEGKPCSRYPQKNSSGFRLLLIYTYFTTVLTSLVIHIQPCKLKG